ncbi:MAG: ethylbenzene dehydrogenase-related protein [Ignavibacteriaceae bacterium]
MKNATKFVALLVLLFTLSISAQTLTVTTGTATLDGVISGGEYTSTPLVTTLGVTLYAMDDGENLYLAATWDDATENVDKKQWSFDGAAWDQSGDEDRLALMFDMGQNDPEGVNCSAMCHLPFMNTSVGKVDVWHWKGHRGNPMGFADDKYFDNVIGGDGGRHGDSGTSTYSDNDDDGSGNPTFMATNDPGANVNFLVNDAAAQTAFDPYGTILPAHTVDIGVTFDLGATFTSGDVIPGYVLRIPGGNRADVMSAGKWDNGTWTVEFKRKNSGSEYDFAVPSGGTVDFVHEIFDNVGHDHWMDGVDGTVYTLDFSNIVSVNGQSGDQLPETYALSQNYPNPFNPITSISYAIPQNSYVSLKVFDVLGNEVQNLVNEKQDAGNYTVTFNANGITSGIYFYQLETENFVTTKKMVLMK